MLHLLKFKKTLPERTLLNAFVLNKNIPIINSNFNASDFCSDI